MKKVTLVVKNGRNHMCAYVCACAYMLMYATHSSTLEWKIPWMEEPGRLQSMELQRVGHNWATSLSFICIVYMYMCAVYVYVVCICVYVCVYVWCVCVHVSLWDMWICMSMCALLCLYMCVHGYVCAYVCVCVCVCVCEGFEAGFTVTIILISVCGVSAQIVGDLLRYTRFYPQAMGSLWHLKKESVMFPSALEEGNHGDG